MFISFQHFWRCLIKPFLWEAWEAFKRLSRSDTLHFYQVWAHGEPWQLCLAQFLNILELLTYVKYFTTSNIHLLMALELPGTLKFPWVWEQTWQNLVSICLSEAHWPKSRSEACQKLMRPVHFQNTTQRITCQLIANSPTIMRPGTPGSKSHSKCLKSLGASSAMMHCVSIAIYSLSSILYPP